MARVSAGCPAFTPDSSGRTPRGALGLVLGLDAVPRFGDMAGCQPTVLVGEDMRMPPDHLARDRLDDVAECECISLLGHPGVKHHLKQEIAELLPEIVEIAARDGIGDLVGFLDGVGSDARKILFEVPGATAAGRPQRRHDFEQA
jgi:hypothetical protein